MDTFEASVKAKHNLMTVEQNNGKNLKSRFIMQFIKAQAFSLVSLYTSRLGSRLTFWIEFENVSINIMLLKT